MPVSYKCQRVGLHLAFIFPCSWIHESLKREVWCQSLLSTLGNIPPLCGWNEMPWVAAFIHQVPHLLMWSHWPPSWPCLSWTSWELWRLVWGRKCPCSRPRTAALIVGEPGKWDNWSLKTLLLNWKSQSSFSPVLSLENWREMIYTRPTPFKMSYKKSQ